MFTGIKEESTISKVEFKNYLDHVILTSGIESEEKVKVLFKESVPSQKIDDFVTLLFGDTETVDTKVAWKFVEDILNVNKWLDPYTPKRPDEDLKLRWIVLTDDFSFLNRAFPRKYDGYTVMVQMICSINAIGIPYNIYVPSYKNMMELID